MKTTADTQAHAGNATPSAIRSIAKGAGLAIIWPFRAAAIITLVIVAAVAVAIDSVDGDPHE